MRAIVAVAVALLLGVAHAGPADPDAARFDAAIALEGQGKLAEAVDALRAFAREHPDHPLAPDALDEAASLCEGRLHDPARALEAWRILAERYPQSRGARRAAVRRAALEPLIAGGEAQALGEYQRLIDEAGVPARPAARAAVKAFLAAHPRFPLAADGQYWLGQTAEQSSQDAEALEHYEAALQLGGDAAPRAARARAELLLRLRRVVEARAAFEALARYPDPASHEALAAGRAAIAAVTRRARWAAVAGGALLVALLLGAALARRALWPPPAELRFFAPVAVLFAAAAATEHRAIARAVGVIALGGALVEWVGGGARARAGSRAARVGVALGTAAAIVAVTYLAIYQAGLVDLVVETWRSGPDR